MENKKLDEFNNKLKKSKVAIIGLGVSNMPLIKYLKNLNVDITVFEKKEIEKIDNNIIKTLRENNIICNFGEEYLKKLKGFDIIFRSPSCRPDIQEIIEEKKRGAIVTSEIEMLIKLSPCKIIGVTGSDGKTTTTSLIYEILKKAKYNCYLGGNIGIPLFDKLPKITEKDIIVLELSSFQLMDMEVSPNISVITNITPNHLDIHKSYNEYIESKKNIFKNQKENDILVLNYNDEIVNKFKEEAKGEVVYFSKESKLENGVMLNDDCIKYAKNGLRRQLLNVKDVKLRGRHNYENICTAIAATKILVDFETAVEAIKEFKGVEHRIEFIREINGVKWYNDSIGSSPTRTIAGLKSFEEPIVLIAGGYDKHLDYEPLARPILDNTSVLILLGQTAQKIEKAVKDECKKLNGEIETLNQEIKKTNIKLKQLNGEKIQTEKCQILKFFKENKEKQLKIFNVKTLEETVEIAYREAVRGDVVLFSPASASFDMFKNFMERGEKFKKLINNLVI